MRYLLGLLVMVAFVVRRCSTCVRQTSVLLVTPGSSSLSRGSSSMPSLPTACEETVMHKCRIVSLTVHCTPRLRHWPMRLCGERRRRARSLSAVHDGRVEGLPAAESVRIGCQAAKPPPQRRLAGDSCGIQSRRAAAHSACAMERCRPCIELSTAFAQHPCCNIRTADGNKSSANCVHPVGPCHLPSLRFSSRSNAVHGCAAANVFIYVTAHDLYLPHRSPD